MLMNTTFLEDSFLIKWQSRGIAENNRKIYCPGIGIWYNETMIFEDIKSL